MFNADFYPTPRNVIDTMCAWLDLSGKRVLEPSAGSGNIVDYLQTFGAEVIACEKHPELASIVSQKCRLLKRDFMEVQSHEISHIDLIVMNPPFSADEKHILHAWNIAPEGCQIVSLCNNETLNNTRYSDRRKLQEILKEYGNSQNLGDVFAKAERKTGVEIGLVRLFKPRISADSEFDGYFDMDDREEDQGNGIMAYSEVRNIVNRYVGAVKMFDSVIEANNKMESLIAPIGGSMDIHFGAFKKTGNFSSSKVDRETFKKELQKSAWRAVFNKLNVTKYVTRKVIEDLNAFIEKQSNVPFTVKNVYLMVEMVYGTHIDRLNSVLVEAFEKICGYSDQNSEAKERWKTNSNYKVNRRFIHPYVCEYDTRWPKNHLDIKNSDQFDDIVKALCLLTGEKYEDQIPLGSFFRYPYHLRRESDGKLMGGYDNYFDQRRGWWSAESRQKELEKEGIIVTIEKTGTDWGQWYDWGFFRVKGHKKGTMHFEFKDEKVWEKFNRKVAEIKGWRLPSQTDQKKKGTERKKQTGVELFDSLYS